MGACLNWKGAGNLVDRQMPRLRRASPAGKFAQEEKNFVLITGRAHMTEEQGAAKMASDSSTVGPSLAELIKKAGLLQEEFAELGGWLLSTINRWCRQRGSDSRRVPRPAWAFLLAYRMLSEEQREILKLEIRTHPR